MAHHAAFGMLVLTGDVRSRLTTPSSATAERGAVAAWWSEGKAYELEKEAAQTRRVRARNSSYRDTRSRSLQRMVRRCGFHRLKPRTNILPVVIDATPLSIVDECDYIGCVGKVAVCQ